MTEFTSQSSASNESKNIARNISTIAKIDRQAIGDIPGLAFIYADNILGCVEIGHPNGGCGGTKVINEKAIKVPKMMRNFCWSLTNEYKIDPKEIKIVGFVMSGHHLTTSIMTFKYGSIALVYNSDRMKLPTTVKEVSRLLPRALKFTYNAAKVIKYTISHLDMVCEDDEERAEVEMYFPPSFEPVTNSDSNKKRKSSQVSEV